MKPDELEAWIDAFDEQPGPDGRQRDKMNEFSVMFTYVRADRALAALVCDDTWVGARKSNVVYALRQALR